MSLEESKAIVRRFVEEVQGKHNLDVVDEVMDPNMIDHYFEMQGVQPPSPNVVETFKKFYSDILAVFPDVKVVIHNMVAEGDLVATHKTLIGTHKGEFMGIPPTGKKSRIEIMDIFRIAGGKMVEHWGIIDWMGLMRQLGAVPSPGQQK